VKGPLSLVKNKINQSVNGQVLVLGRFLRNTAHIGAVCTHVTCEDWGCYVALVFVITMHPHILGCLLHSMAAC
jgi:hypothetical protein